MKKKVNYKDKLDRVFSLFIRYRDVMPNGFFKCISCGKIKPFSQGDNGHYINRQHMITRYDEMNNNMQCRHCNRFMEGNIQNYRKGLIDKYGEKNVQFLENKQHFQRHFFEVEYIELIKYYTKEYKKLKEEKGL